MHKKIYIALLVPSISFFSLHAMLEDSGLGGWAQRTTAHTKENFYPGRIHPTFHCHVSSLQFLAAKELIDEELLKVGLESESCVFYVAWIKKVIAYNGLMRGFKPFKKEDFPDTYDCPDEVFYRLSKKEILPGKAFEQARIDCSDHPLTRKSLIEHGVSYPIRLGGRIGDIRVEIKDVASRTLQAIQCGDISLRDVLVRAASLEHPETLKEIIACYHVSDHDKKVALYTAVLCNSPKSCQIIAGVISDFERFIEDRPEFLQGAAIDGFSEIVTFLLEHGADVSAVDGFERAALDKASEWGHLEVVRLLLQHGANAKNPKALESAGLCVDRPKITAEIVRELLKYGADLSVLEQKEQDDYRRLLIEYPEEAEIKESSEEDSSSSSDDQPN